MRQLNGVYTQTFNRRHCRVGHVFQGRYKAILVEKNDYLLELARYVVRNPVRAEMVRSPLEWPWSSYRAMVGHPPHLAALRTDWLLCAFSEHRAEAVERYKAFVADGGNQPSPWESLKNQIYLGSDSFVEDIQQHITDEDKLSEIPSSQRRAPAKPLDHYVAISATRNEAICLAYASGGYSLKQIGEFFGLHYSGISRIIRDAKGKT